MLYSLIKDLCVWLGSRSARTEMYYPDSHSIDTGKNGESARLNPLIFFGKTNGQWIPEPPFDWPHGFRVTVSVPPQQASHGSTKGLHLQISVPEGGPFKMKNQP